MSLLCEQHDGNWPGLVSTGFTAGASVGIMHTLSSCFPRSRERLKDLDLFFEVAGGVKKSVFFFRSRSFLRS